MSMLGAVISGIIMTAGVVAVSIMHGHEPPPTWAAVIITVTWANLVMERRQ